MEKMEVIGTVAVMGFTSILFTPIGTDFWKYPFVVGIIFSGVWLWKK